MADLRIGGEGSQAVSVPRPGVRGLVDRFGMTTMIVVALVSHAFNMFQYPVYLGDEGIYLEQAWAIIREGRLAPYTYFYDHAPAGWIFLAWWEMLLPRHFLTFGMADNSGRTFMLVLQIASTALLYKIALRLAHNHVAAITSTVAFTLSPLALYYQRMVLIDNIMVFWVLLSVYLVLWDNARLMRVLSSGAAFGMAILSKENAVFFAPVLLYLLYTHVRGSYRTRFAMVGWVAAMCMLVSLYPLYALLKNELLPADTLIGTGNPTAHVSMISTVLWQMSRHGGSIFNPYSQFWQFFWGNWWIKDPIIIVAGVVATFLNLFVAFLDRRQRSGYIVVAMLSVMFTLYLARGSVMIDFYVVPVLPFFSLNVGMLLSAVATRLPIAVGSVLACLVILALTVGFLAQSHDEYFVNQTQLQVEQLAFIRQNIPTSAFLIVDDDLWVDLHEPNGNEPVYPLAHSHWKVAGDPAIYDKLLNNDWRNVDYMIMSNKMHDALVENNETLALTAYNHSRVMARFVEGDVSYEVREVIKPST